MKGGLQQRGGFALGLVVGLLIGLVLALGVALFVTKAPVPFINKVPQRTAEHDAAEAERNKNWNPNAPLQGSTPTPAPRAAASVPAAAPAPGVAPAPAAPVVAAPAPAASKAAAAPAPSAGANPAPNPAAILSGAITPGAGAGAATNPAVVAPKKAGEDPFVYFIQAGAFTRPEDAEGQRARIALLGAEARITEREQSGRTVYRVRLGPFKSKAEADAASEKLSAAAVEATLVRVERPPQ